MTTHPRLVTQSQAAEILAVSVKTIARMRASGRLRWVDLGNGRIRILHEDIAALVERGRRGTAGDPA